MGPRLFRTRKGFTPACIPLLFITLAFLPGTLAAQWITVRPVDSTVNMFSIDFPTKDVGYSVGWGPSGSAILKTTDAGANWSRLNVNGALLFTAHFSDPDNGMIAGYLASCNCGLLMKTTDGGTTWATGSSQSTFGFYTLSFPTTDTGYVCGYNGAILKTTDGGSNWQVLATGTADVFRRIHFPSAQVGYGLAGVGTNFSQPGQIYKTDDGGATWNRIQDFTGTRTLSDVYFVNDNTGFIVGHDGKEAIYKTTDGGSTWNAVFHGTTNDVPQSIAFADATTGYVGSTSGRVVRTIDGGNTWSVEETGTPRTFLALAFKGDVGYAGADSGVIMKRTGTQSVAGNGIATGDASIMIAPNPMGSSALVTLLNVAPGTHYTFSLYDMLGREVKRIDGVQGTEGFTLLRDGLASGSYVYRLETGPGNGRTGSLIVR